MMTQHGKVRQNLRLARNIWGSLSKIEVQTLKSLVQTYELAIAAGDLQLLEGRWYITHSGLLRISEVRRCAGIRTLVEKRLSDPASNRWVFKATVYKTPRSKGFVGYGDADPSNVSQLVRGAEMRVAETRAVNRALRKAYGIGLCSVEELGSFSSRPEPSPRNTIGSAPSNGNGTNNGQPRLRDRLCLLIRQHQLDPTLVKRYAADFCGTQELRKASRESIESFVTTLAQQAATDRDALVCKLNSYGNSDAVQR
jgi:hypothetical protein